MTTALSTVSLPRRSAVGSQSVHVIGDAPAAAIPLGQSNLRYEVVHAIEGNHLAIQELLHRVLHQPTSVEFTSATLRPGYVPAERLVIKRPSDRRLVAHLQLQPQVMRFRQVMVPSVHLRDLAVLDEYEVRGFSDQMLLAAHQDAQRSGAMIMTTRATDEDVFRRHNWAALGYDPVSVVSPQRLLGQLPAAPEPESPFYSNSFPRCETRLGRLTDLAAFMGLYERQATRSYGPLTRDEDYWTWLITRRAHDRMYLYTEDEKPLAYIIVRGASLVELVDQTSDKHGAARLMERVGADAIEQGRHSIRIHAPRSDLVHQWSEAAGGHVFAGADDCQWFARIVSPRKLLRRLGTELHQRYDASLPRELSLRIGSEDLLLRPGVRSLRVTRGVAKKHRLAMSSQAATQLLFGYRDAAELAAAGQLVSSTDKALDSARRLFPKLLLWRPCWDEVSALSL